MMMLLFSFGIMISISKLMSSKSMMTSLISIEMMMSNMLMFMICANLTWDQSYFVIMTICLVVCEGTIGISILSSTNKIKSNSFLFSLSSIK